MDDTGGRIVDQHLLHHGRDPLGGRSDNGELKATCPIAGGRSRHVGVQEMDRGDSCSQGIREPIVHISLGTGQSTGRGTLGAGFVWT